MKSFKNLLIISGCLLPLLLVTSVVSASIDAMTKEKAAQAESHLKIRVGEVLDIVRDPVLIADPSIQEQALYDKGLEIFDFKTFSMLALGIKYRSFSDEQREEFIHYFSKLISKTYFPKLAGQDVQDVSIFYLVHALF